MRSAIVLLLFAIGASGGRPQYVQAEGWHVGIGVMGDSYSDEYAFYPPHRDRARNWVELLATTRGLNFGPYSVASRGEPRNQGYAYNWARSGATTSDLLAQGQHTGLAEQVARGEVGVVCVFIGGNDFLATRGDSDPSRTLAEAARIAAANLEVAVRTIFEASDSVKVLIATVPDLRELPELAEAGRSGGLDDQWFEAASEAAQHYNAAIRSLAVSEPRIAVVDLHLSTRLSRLIFPKRLYFGGKVIERNGYGDSPEHAFLADRRHLGTVVQGLLARAVVAAINLHVRTRIQPPTDKEILDLAIRAANGSPELAEGAASRSSLDAEVGIPSAAR